MYNILEKDTGKRINFIARSHDRGTHRISDISVETNKGKRALQRNIRKCLTQEQKSMPHPLCKQLSRVGL